MTPLEPVLGKVAKKQRIEMLVKKLVKKTVGQTTASNSLLKHYFIKIVAKKTPHNKCKRKLCQKFANKNDRIEKVLKKVT